MTLRHDLAGQRAGELGEHLVVVLAAADSLSPSSSAWSR